MNIISFPGLNLKFEISRIALKIGNANIYWYAVLIVSAILIGVFFAKKKDGLYNIKFDNVLECALIMIPVAFVFARIYYCIFKIDEYFKNPINILDVRSGGLAIYGGIIGGLLTCIVYCKKKKINLLDLLDYIVPALALGQSIGRWGNFINIEAYGLQTNLPWRMGIYENNNYIEVHPTFLYESIVTFILFVILTKLQKKRKIKGEITYIYLIIYSFARFFIEGLRSDSLMLYNLRISQILSAVIFVVSCYILTYKKIKYKKTKVDD